MSLQPLTPRTKDGRPILATSAFPSGCVYYVTSHGDGETTRGDGEACCLSHEGADAATLADLYIDFLDVIYLEGGILRWQGAVDGDWLTMGIRIPATPVSSTPGTGNCALVPNPNGGYIIVPATGGSHTVDLNDAYPVPSSLDPSASGTGYWAWDDAQTGRGTIAAAPLGDGGYHLMTAAAPELRFVNRFLMLDDGTLDLRPPTTGRKILPHWSFFARLHSAGRPSGTVRVCWAIKCGRYRTY